MRLVAPLRDFGRDDLATAGGKGANLGELVRMGLSVPDGIVITTSAYATAIGQRDLKIDERIAAGESASIRAAVEATRMSPNLRAEIARAYAALRAGPVAVRSSATAEDLPGAAFAGQQDTYLDVVGEDAVIDAVQRCWGSLWTERAIAYRGRIKIDSADVSMAVVVQHMINADAAGVMFTADPITGNRETIMVEASTGLGEAVVSGTVTPDHYLLDDQGRVCEFQPGDPNRSQRLAHPVLAKLVQLGLTVAEHFERSQDIELAYADDQVWLLHARPMTALPPPPVTLNATQRRIGSVLLDYVPMRPYPIDMSTWVPYGPVGLMAKVTARFGIRDPFDKFLVEDEYGIVDRLVPRSPRPTPAVLLAPWRIGKLARRYDPAHWTEDPRFADFLARVQNLVGQDLQAMPWRWLKTVPRQALDAVNPIGNLRIDYLPRAGLALLRLLTSPTQSEAPETVLALIKVLTAESPRPVEDHDHALSELLKHPLLRGARQRARLQRWVEAARAEMAFREDSHFYFLMPLPILRKSLLEMGRRLCVVGVLDEPEQVFHLRLEELEAIEDPAALAEPEKLRATMLRRAARREELAGVRLIDPTAVFPQRDVGDALITGTPASSGTATGPVKVIRGPEEFDRLAAGDILVCPYTNPAWTTLFQRAAAVVVDSGGPGSHAAIVAREYGIPAVLGTGVGTRVFTDGQLVTVDGGAGRVLAAVRELLPQ